MKCRFCDALLNRKVIDLVSTPPSNSFLTAAQLNDPEVYFPLKLYVCKQCFLVQIDEHKDAKEIFNAQYAYFSSYSKSWLDHCRRFAESVIPRFGLNGSSLVVELASNDGYLLQYFKERGIPTLGIEPTENTARVAIERGIDTQIRFFGTECASDLAKGKKPELIIANNVLAHVPDINDFVSGMKALLASKGVCTAEFPHLLQLMTFKQFDTIYHEHFSYFSFSTICLIFKRHGLRIFDVEEIPTHGGSLRIYADHGSKEMSSSVERLIDKEKLAGMNSLDFYAGFQEAADQIKYRFISFLQEAKDSKKKVVGYGAAAKGNTLLNYCGVRSDLISHVVDASPHKQGKFLPGSHIPVVSDAIIGDVQPDYVVILPWNLKIEISEQLRNIRQWDGHFVTAIPDIQVF